MAYYCNKQADDVDRAVLIQANPPTVPRSVEMSADKRAHFEDCVWNSDYLGASPVTRRGLISHPT